MTIQNNNFERELELQANLFAMQSGRENEGAVRTFIVCDFEYAYDQTRYSNYCRADEIFTKDKPRWPFHTFAAASWVVMRFRPGIDTPEIEAPIVMSVKDHTPLEMMTSFLDAVLHEPTAVICTWGGEYKDLAALRRLAMENGVVLPWQIANPSPYSRQRIDLSDAVSVKADSVHLPEFAHACSIPSKPLPSKSIGKLVQFEVWDKVEEQCVADVLTASVIMIRYLVSHGQIVCDQNATIMALADATAEAMPNIKFVQHTFRNWARACLVASKLTGMVYRAEGLDELAPA